MSFSDDFSRFLLAYLCLQHFVNVKDGNGMDIASGEKVCVNVLVQNCFAHCQTVADVGEEFVEVHAYKGRRLPLTAFQEIMLKETSGMRLLWLLL